MERNNQANGFCKKINNFKISRISEQTESNPTPPSVEIKISEVGLKLFNTEKTAGSATAKLKNMEKEEAERQRKIEYMHSLEDRLNNENLSADDRKSIETDIAYFKKETMTNRDKINELKSEMIQKEKECKEKGIIFNPSGYMKLIQDRENWQKNHDQEVKLLLRDSRQEIADLEANEMKSAEAEAQSQSKNDQIGDFNNALESKESLERIEDLLNPQQDSSSDSSENQSSADKMKSVEADISEQFSNKQSDDINVALESPKL